MLLVLLNLKLDDSRVHWILLCALFCECFYCERGGHLGLGRPKTLKSQMLATVASASGWRWGKNDAVYVHGLQCKDKPHLAACKY